MTANELSGAIIGREERRVLSFSALLALRFTPVIGGTSGAVVNFQQEFRRIVPIRDLTNFKLFKRQSFRTMARTPAYGEDRSRLQLVRNFQADINAKNPLRHCEKPLFVPF